jgi:Sec-independent protein translocase protein TatA
MNGLGFQEILVIAALIILFIRQNELPVIFRKVGKAWAKVYYYYTLMKKELRNMEQEIGIEEEMKEIRAINARMKSEIANFDRAISDTTKINVSPEKKPDEKKES